MILALIIGAQLFSLVRLIRFLEQRNHVRVIYFTILFILSFIYTIEIMMMVFNQWGIPAVPIIDYLVKEKHFDVYIYIESNKVFATLLNWSINIDDVS